jgi:hypothetical protein
MNMLGFGHPPAVRKRGVQGDVRPKKRSSHRDKPGVSRSGEEVRNVHRSRGTGIEGLESVVPTRKVAELPTSNVREPVSVPVLESMQDGGIDELLNRCAVVEEVVRREADDACVRFAAVEEEVRTMKRCIEMLVADQRDLATRIEQRAAADTVTVLAQEDVIQQWKQETGASVTALRQTVGTANAVVEAEKQNNGSVHAAEKSKAATKIGSKEKPGLVVATVKGETASMEEKPKMEEEVPYPAAVGSIEERQYAEVSFRSVQLEFLKLLKALLRRGYWYLLGLGLRWMFVGLWA